MWGELPSHSPIRVRGRNLEDERTIHSISRQSVMTLTCEVEGPRPPSFCGTCDINLAMFSNPEARACSQSPGDQLGVGEEAVGSVGQTLFTR